MSETTIKRFTSELDNKRKMMAGKVADVEQALAGFSFYEVVGFLTKYSCGTKRFFVFAAVFNENNSFVEKIVLSAPRSSNHIVLKHMADGNWNIVFDVSDVETGWMERFCELLTDENVPQKKTDAIPN